MIGKNIATGTFLVILHPSKGPCVWPQKVFFLQIYYWGFFSMGILFTCHNFGCAFMKDINSRILQRIIDQTFDWRSAEEHGDQSSPLPL